MSLANEYTDNFFMDDISILDAHLRLLFHAYHYETPCKTRLRVINCTLFSQNFKQKP
jgi:hypothetical protein